MKKVLSFVLILALVLGSFSFAFGLSDIADSKNTEAITVASDLGIITGYEDGTFLPEKTVNRAEFAAMITRALAVPDSALAAYSATSFKDTSGYGWAVPYLAFCESKGIMIGDGMGNVMPGRTINVNEAITMAVRAIGYTENSAMLVGTWPSNYVTLAQTLGLYDDVAAATMVSRESAAQVIYNALTVALVTVNADGTTTPSDKTMLTAGLKCEVTKNVVVDPGQDSKIGLVKYAGAYGDIYSNKDNEVVAIGNVRSEFMTGKITANGEFTSDDVEYSFVWDANQADSSLSSTPKAISLTNGVKDAGYPTTVAISSAATDTMTLAVDKSGKTINTIYSVAKWSNVNAQQATDNTVKVINEDKTLNGLNFQLDGDDNIDLKSFALYGVASLQDIAKDNVVEVWEADIDGDSDNEITRVKVGTKTVTGKVTLVATEDGDKVFTIDGNKYFNAKDEPTIGDTGTAYLNYDGDIWAWDVEDGSTGDYAMMTGKVKNVDAYTATSQVSLFYKDGTEKNYTFKKDKGATVVSTHNEVDTLVKFKLNSDGEITELTAVAASNSGIVSNAAVSKLTAKGTFAGKLLADTVVVFVDKGDQEYAIGAVADVEVDKEIYVRYGLNKDGKIDAMVVKEANAGAKAVYGFVVTTANGINAKGDAALVVKALVNGESVTYVTDLGADADDYNGTVDKLVKFSFAGEELTSAVAIGAVALQTTEYAANKAGAYSASGSAFKFVSTAGVDKGRIEMATSSGTEYVLVDDSATVVLATFNSDNEVTFVKGNLGSINNNYKVALIQIDNDSVVYDFVVYVKYADITKLDNSSMAGALN